MLVTRVYVVSDSMRNVCWSTSGTRGCNANCSPVMSKRRGAKKKKKKTITFAFRRCNKFVANDTLGQPSLADGLNKHRIAAACYICCRSYHENEQFGASNSYASSQHIYVWISQEYANLSTWDVTCSSSPGLSRYPISSITKFFKISIQDYMPGPAGNPICDRLWQNPA